MTTSAEIVALYEQPGMSIEKVARALGVTLKVTRQAIVDAGVTLRQCGNQPGMERKLKPCKGMTWAGLNDRDIPEVYEIRTTYKR